MPLLQLAAALLYVAVFAVLVRDLVRRPRRPTVDAALFFGAITLAIGFGAAGSIGGVTLPGLISAVLVVVVLALPYLLLRLVDDYRGVATRVLRIAEAGLVLAAVGVVAAPRPVPFAVGLFVVAYFVVLLGYCAASLLRTAAAAGALVSLRLRSIAAGAALLALAVGGAAAAGADPALKDAFAILGQVAALGSGIAFVLGFAPPAPLRQVWLEPRLRAFLQRTTQLANVPTVDALLPELASAAQTALGLGQVSIARWDEPSETLYATFEGKPSVTSSTGTLGGQALRERRPIMSDNPSRDYPVGAATYARLDVRALLVAPILVRGRAWGILAVTGQRGSLFVRDDLAVLALLADQAADAITNAELLAEVRRLRDEANRRSDAALARLGAIVGASADAIVGLSLDGLVTEWNPAAERLFGYVPAEMIGQSIATVGSTAQGEAMQRVLERVRAGERIDAAEFEYRRRDGRPIDVSLSIGPIGDGTGAVTGAALIARDITERRREERAFAALREVAFAAGHMLEPERLAEFAVERARSVLGIETAALYWLDTSAGVLKLMARSTTGSQPGIAEIRPGEGLSGAALERREPVVVEDYSTWPQAIRSGSATIASGMAVPLLVGERVVGTLLLSSYTPHTFPATDVQFLTLFGAEVAPALEASRLLLVEQRQQVVEEASRAKSEFLANMSHELRTPLNAILGFSELLSEQLGAALSERQLRFLRNISDAGTHLLELINDVLDLSKVEAGKVDLRPELITLDALLDPAMSSTRTAADAKNVRLEVEAATVQALFLDPTRVRQILYNLLSNAVKFTPSGGSVTLRAAVEGPDLLLEIADTGIGIPADKRDRVFGVFERLHEGRSQASGTGLGLALTKRLVELHRGTIAFESVEGQGTTFRVRLPDVHTVPVGGPRVLVVEDDRRDAELVVALAASLDLRTEVVRSLAAADHAIERGWPIGVVLDERLPDGRGDELLRRLRSGPTSNVPIIVVTVEAEPEPAFALGADDYLTKPLDRERLGRWLKKVARQSSAIRQADGEDPLAHPAG